MIRHTVNCRLAALALAAAAGAAGAAPVQEGTAQAQPPATAGPQPQVYRPEAAQQGNSAYGLLREIEALKAEISRLRGQNEMLEHKIESLSKRQSDLYLDLDKRVEELRKQAREASQAAVAPPPGAAAKADPLAEARAYEAALEHFKAGSYDKAIAGFADFLKLYPDSTLAANAQYWTGYAYYAKKDYKNALEQQTRLVSAYPQSPKVADALLNIANSQIELKETAAAKKTLQEIVAKYPGTNAATLAAKRLALLK